SSATTLLAFIASLIILITNSANTFNSLTSPILWVFTICILIGTIAGNLYYITIPTLVTRLVEEDRRDRANGMFGTITGVSFTITSLFSGITLAFLGMGWVIGIAIVSTIIAILFLMLFVFIPENKIIH